MAADRPVLAAPRDIRSREDEVRFLANPIWQTTIGVDVASAPQFERTAAPEPTAGPAFNRFEAQRGLMAMARLSGGSERTRMGLCQRCRQPGHLTKDCRNHLVPGLAADVDISSTSSESEGPNPAALAAAAAAAAAEAYGGGGERKRERRRRRSSTSSSSSEEERRRRRRKRKEKKKKRERRRRHSVGAAAHPAASATTPDSGGDTGHARAATARQFAPSYRHVRRATRTAASPAGPPDAPASQAPRRAPASVAYSVVRSLLNT